MSDLRFEDVIKRLEEIVAELEKGDLQLDTALMMFEEGVRLSKECLKILDNAEKRVEILMQDRDGVKRPRPFEIEEEKGEG